MEQDNQEMLDKYTGQHLRDKNLIQLLTTELTELDKKCVLKTWLPIVVESISDVGGKSQTRFMDRHFTIEDKITPIARASQCLAEISSILSALNANEFDVKNMYIRSAIIRCAGFCEMYRDICNQLGVDKITNEMVELNQPKEQLMTMFMQSYEEAIANGGLVDAGDLKYARQCKIDPSECQYEVTKYLINERSGKMEVHEPIETMQWLEGLFKKYEHRVNN